jgi:hypothetical protein
MADSSPVDDWLDRWEELREAGQDLSPEEFIRQHCGGAPPGFIEDFRRQASALRSMEADLLAAGASAWSTGREEGADTGEPDAGAAELKPGAEPVPGYRLVRRLGRGGFGVVWEATAPGGFHVALKFVWLGRQVRDPELRALETIKDIRHPHLLSLFGAYQKHGYLIIAMELAERTLEDRFREASAQGLPGIPTDELLEYAAEAAEALDYLNQPRHPSGEGPPRRIQQPPTPPRSSSGARPPAVPTNTHWPSPTAACAAGGCRSKAAPPS